MKTPATFVLSHRFALSALSALALAMLPGVAVANQSLSSSGYGLTTGPVFNRSNLGSAAYNPANAMRLVADDENFRVGGFELGMRYEIGDLNDVAGMRDAIKADIDTATTTPTVSSAENLATNISTRYLPALNVGARLSTQGRASLVTPVLMRTQSNLPGVWSFNVNAQAQMSGAFRGSDVSFLTKVKSGNATANVEVNVAQALSSGVLSSLETAVKNNDYAAQKTALDDLQAILNSASDQASLQTVIDNAVKGDAVGAEFVARTASAFDFKLAEVNQISLGYAYNLTPHTPDGMRELLPNGHLDVGLRLNA